jgi:hypothetical protein
MTHENTYRDDTFNSVFVGKKIIKIE